MKRFGADSTTRDVLDGIDLSGARVLVTGVSSGLGLETARAATAHGARVVGTARRAVEPDAAPGVEVTTCDLASLASVRTCADSLNARGEAFDVVIANAGVMNAPLGRTADGYETHFGTNHLGHFVLVNRITPLLRDGGRVITLTSTAHHAADVDLEDPGFEKADYDPFLAYGRSKTANVLFAVELDRRLRDRGIRSIAVQPGGINTPLLRHTTPDVMHQMMEHMAAQVGPGGKTPSQKTVEQGAATTAWAGFVAPAVEVGGRYCEDCQVAAVVDSGIEGVRSYAVDPERARALWATSEELVGERFA